mgnify:CR=1 FL=1
MRLSADGKVDHVTTLEVDPPARIVFSYGFASGQPIDEAVEQIVAVSRLLLDAQDKWLLMTPEPVPAILLSASILTPGLVVLCLVTGDGRRHAFILTEANMEADALRRLRGVPPSGSSPTDSGLRLTSNTATGNGSPLNQFAAGSAISLAIAGIQVDYRGLVPVLWVSRVIAARFQVC